MSTLNDIPIFDCLTHPMPSGDWIDGALANRNTLAELSAQMQASNTRWALAVGMGPDIGGYREAAYPAFVASADANLFPVAFLPVNALANASVPELRDYFRKLVTLGYVGVKLHPRIGHFQILDEHVVAMIECAADAELAVLLCTYNWGNGVTSVNGLHAIQELLARLDAPIILLHGGAVALMETIEIVRAYPNVLLDLSFTLHKYQGSSIDLDLQYAFNLFDRRICVGSDFPEWSLTATRERFDDFARSLAPDRAQAIAYQNLAAFVPRARLE